MILHIFCTNRGGKMNEGFDEEYREEMNRLAMEMDSEKFPVFVKKTSQLQT